MDFIDDHDINFHHLGLSQSSNAWDSISEEVVLEALEIVLNGPFPLCVMCNQGRHRTGFFNITQGTVVGCFRKLQKWNLTSIFEEYRRYSYSCS